MLQLTRKSLFLAAIIPLTPAAGAEKISSLGSWMVNPPFEKSEDARTALSGAACATGTNHCLVVNDEKRYGQFFDISGRQVVPTELIRLLPDKVDGVKMDEIDAEGVAYRPASEPSGTSWFYVTGSHGLSRKGKLQLSQFFIFRFPVDPSTGRPNFRFGDFDPGPEIERTAQLRDTIKNAVELAPHAEQKLDRNGVTIEGIAVQGAEALFGLRSPCIEGNAYVMHVPLRDLFTGASPTASVSKLALGDNVGVRDLAAVRDGVLILAGRSDDDKGDGKFTCGEQRSPTRPVPSLWFWSGRFGEEPQKLGNLPGVDASQKPEALLLLEETATAYRTLVLFDGVENGGPIEFKIGK